MERVVVVREVVVVVIAAVAVVDLCSLMLVAFDATLSLARALHSMSPAAVVGGSS